MRRLGLIFVIVLIGAAAPARAWCEASCVTPSDTNESGLHCPAHEPDSNGPAISAAAGSDCPTIELQRPVTPKIVFASVGTSATTHLALRYSNPHPLRHTGAEAPRHLTSAPLRI